MRHVVLDTGVLGLLTHPSNASEPRKCKEWLNTLLWQDVFLHVPEIADYELRRELLRMDSTRAISHLDALRSVIGYLPITTAAMMKAAEFWADARKAGKPTADTKAIDVDVILAAQAVLLAGPDDLSIVATNNVRHFRWFIDARRWQDIA